MANLSFTVGGAHTGNYSSNPVIFGSAEADQIQDTTGGVPHTIFGGAGGDSLVGSAGAGVDQLYGEAGNDTLEANANGAGLYGGDGDDVITGGAGVDTIYGGTGNDTVDITGTGADTVYGEAGNDVIDATASTAVKLVYGGDGKDTITGGTAADTIYGDAGDDIIIGGTGASKLDGGAGNDSIKGAGAADTITGGTGNDTIITAAGADVITFASGDGNDIVTDFTAGTDKLNVSATKANLTFTRNTANELVVGISGTTDTINLGATAGTYDLVASDGAAKVIVTDTTATYASDVLAYEGKAGVANTVSTTNSTGAATYDLTSSKFYSIEKFDNSASWFGGSVVRGTTGADTLVAANAIVGGTTGDQLWGRAGADSLVGGNGNDVFWYGLNEGNDVVNNASKDDVVYLYNVNSADVSYVLNGTDLQVRFANSSDILTIQGWNTSAATQAKIRTADKAAFTPVVTSNGVITTSQTTGKTTIDLTNYTNVTRIDNTANLTGGSVLRGASTNDTLQASAYGDQLWGRTGTDSLVGGAGSDVFWYGRSESDKTIANYTLSDDVVKLYNLNLADANYAYDGTDLVMSFVGGDRVTVKGTQTAKIASADYASGVKVTALNTTNNQVAYVQNAIHFGGTGTSDQLVYAGADKLTIDLENTASYRNLEYVNASTSTSVGTVIRGTSGANKLEAAVGGSQLWGRAGADTLVGDVADAAADTFWVGSGEGAKTINHFDVGTAATKDTLKLYNANLADVSFKGLASGAVEVSFTGSADKTTLAGSAAIVNTGLKVQTADHASGINAVVATSAGAATYIDNTYYYYGSTTADTLTGGATGTIDLSSSKVISFESGVASAAAGSVLRGSEGDNILTAGTNGAQLWGRGGNDTLIGTNTKADIFWFGKDEGADVVKNFESGTDTIMLYTAGLTAADVTIAASGTNDLVFTIGTGTLTVEGGKSALVGGSTIKLADGNNYTVELASGAYALKKV